MTVRTRIAPSPTGQLHIGSLATALRNYAYANKHQGQFVIRIEDTDQERLVEGATQATLEVIRDYGLSWDEGPDKKGPYGPYIQSKRLKLYQDHVYQLIQKEQAYYCFCTKDRLAQMRADQQASKQVPKYDRHCLKLSKDEINQKLSSNIPYVVRLKVPPNQTITVNDLIRGQITFSSNEIDDQVLLKSDGFPTYHLAVVVDDHLMKISHIIRGEEWISSTPKHVLLYQAFGWSEPVYAHTPVFLSPTGKGKMSKRHGDVNARAFLEKGYLPEAVLNFLMIMGWAPKDKNEVMDLDRFVQEFDIKDISAKSVVFDTDKLNWLNGLYIRKLSDPVLLQKLQPFKPKELSQEKLETILPHIKERLVKLSDLAELTDFIYDYHKPKTKLLLKRSDTLQVTTQLDTTIQTLDKLSSWSVSSIESAVRNLQETYDWHRGQFFMMLRLASTGKSATPPLFDSLYVIGQKELISRLELVKKLLNNS